VVDKPRALSDPGAIKALAHPARLVVLEALADGGELTATECAAVAGISPSAMSYHLRALEKWGFVERAKASADGRERPWRALPGGWRVDPGGDAASTAATALVVQVLLERLREDLARWYEREPGQPMAWREATTIATRSIWLTPAEIEELQTVQDDYVQHRRGRTTANHPEGARRVRVSNVMVPLQFD
jgi:DNA-binding transcriptional ArsR family regulator